MIDSREVALKKANDDILYFVHRGKFDRLETREDEYVVHSTTGSSRYPFADLKDGDLCSISIDDNYIDAAYYADDRFFFNYHYNSKLWSGGVKKEAVFIAKTGFNILEHLEEQS